MAQPSWIGQKLNDRYEIQDMLGQGDMSAVYKAYDPDLRRIVTIKLIHQHLSENPEFMRRFEEGAAAVVQLRHPNLLQVYDFAHDGDTYYIVFEFIPGEMLQGRLKRLNANNRNFEIQDVVTTISKTADGLHYAHDKGLIHRDIKPANIMINVSSDPIVMNLGIAKIMGSTQHTATGAVLGTARYMSPEQIKGDRVDARTDIYSLGVVLFELLGGRPPFEADSAVTLMMMHMTDPIPDLSKIRPDIPADLVEVVNKSLAKNRDARYQTAAEMVAALNNVGSAPAKTHETPVIIPASERTILEPSTGRSETIQPASEPTPSVTPGPAPSSSGNQRTLFMAIGGVILLFIIGYFAYTAFFGGGDGGGATETAVPPTQTPEPEFFVRITGITLDGDTYVVPYETTGYTEQLPGMHVHFYFNGVPESEAGIPGGGPWISHGGPRPFTGYTASHSDRGNSTAICARVANADHSIIYSSGNCWDLP